MSDKPLTPAQMQHRLMNRVLGQRQTGSVFCRICQGNDWSGRFAHMDGCPVAHVLPPTRTDGSA
ncbi:hypothetical protein GO986_17790 [Deinococcus sp. HMF7620]|uniref:Uncharacterized protein n=1 Tax=Deinococcus arboris TaxID=2682977 RepID=A0A7C9I521_9DEIO|nr:hypothetical protein [Deinococcus arboris]MVN88591.1 hypothetical protein [Deinococcus arboris]